jgi:hypothetical protein
MASIIKSLIFNTSTNKNNSSNFNLLSPVTVSEGYLLSQFIGINSVYNFDSRNNIFAFTEASTTLFAFIPTGNYTINTLITTLASILTSSGTTTYTVTNNTLTNKITISAANSFKIIQVDKNCYYELGMLNSVFENPSQGYFTEHIAPSSFDLSGLKQINVVSNSFGYGNCLAVNKNLNVIATIPVTVAYQGVISYSSPNSVFISSQIDSIQNVDFILYDSRFRELKLDRDFVITLLFTQ